MMKNKSKNYAFLTFNGKNLIFKTMCKAKIKHEIWFCETNIPSVIIIKKNGDDRKFFCRIFGL